MFSCTVGVRKCENFSRFKFALHFNDLEGFFLSTNDAKGFFVLLHTDDTMLFSESPDDLQHRFVVF